MATVDLQTNPVPVADIDATGTPSSSTFLRGDGAWETPAGGGGSTASLLESSKSSSDDPPDDEFDDTTGMSGAINGLDAKWTAVAGTEAAVSLLESGNVARYDLDTIPGKLLLQVGGATTNTVELRQDYTLADGDAVVLAVSPAISEHNVNNDIWLGLALNSTDTGYADGASSQKLSLHFENNGEPTILLFDGSTAFHDQSFVPLTTMFLRISRSGLTYYGHYSPDGHAWQPAGSKTFASALTNLWIFKECNTNFAGLPPISMFHWIRKGSGSAVDPWSWR